MTLYLIFGLISVIVMALIVKMLHLVSRPTTVSVILYRAAPKSIFLTVKKTQKPSLVPTVQEKQLQGLYQSHISQQDVILSGTSDISGIGRQWAVSSPTISLKVLRSLPNL